MCTCKLAAARAMRALIIVMDLMLLIVIMVIMMPAAAAGWLAVTMGPLVWRAADLIC